MSCEFEHGRFAGLRVVEFRIKATDADYARLTQHPHRADESVRLAGQELAVELAIDHLERSWFAAEYASSVPFGVDPSLRWLDVGWAVLEQDLERELGATT